MGAAWAAGCPLGAESSSRLSRSTAALPEAAGPAAACPLESAPSPPSKSSAKLAGVAATDALGVSSSSKLSRSFTTLPFVGACTCHQMPVTRGMTPPSPIQLSDHEYPASPGGH